ncbi:tetratricopeptide repeat protein [Eisenibacter elegans]|uniref:tetratricopeptide repeat protein n=1 Tax=Eisenibacter elegans TaxID=997 RepID=UPI00047AE26E|nr:tetratricopeptide repeat protein [Eisenibacter elegans]
MKIHKKHLSLALVWLLWLPVLGQAQTAVADYFQKGKLELQLGDYNQAINYFTKVIQLDAAHKDAFFERGKSWFFLKKYQQALWDFDKYTQLAPQVAEGYLYKGATYQALKNETQAIAQFDKAISLNPNYSLAYNYRAEAYRAIGLTTLSITDYTRAIAIDSQSATLHYGRGKCYLDIEQYANAAEDFTKAINLNPKNLNFYHQRIQAYFLAGEYELTSLDIDNILAVAPQTLELYHHSLNAFCKAALKDYSGAIAALNFVIEAAPDSAKLYQERAYYHEQNQDLYAALEDYHHVAQLSPSLKLDSTFVRLYVATQNYEAAIVHLTQSIEAAPKDSGLYYERGLCYLQLQQPREAQQDFVQAAVHGYPREAMPKDIQKMAKKGFATRKKMLK